MNTGFRRLRRRDFPILLTTGRRATTKNFSLTYTDAVSGCAAVVGKKIAKTAVKRHLLKRRILAVCRAGVPPAKGCVVFARKGAETLSYKNIEDEIHTLFVS